jgi:uncharacterized membrane protein (UPF0127 family)
MKLASVYNRTRARSLATRALVAESDHERHTGLNPYSSMDHGDAFVLYPVSSITTQSLTFPIDLLFIGPDMNVHRLYSDVIPGSIVSPKSSYDRWCVVELPAGVIEQTGTERGDMIGFGWAR